MAWKSTDGSDQVLPPFLGGEAVGMWRPTPPDFIPGIFQHFATVTPWSINSPSQFQPQGPPALASRRYAADFNEVKTMGSSTSATRTSDQTIYTLFWGWTTASYLWNNLAVSLIERPSRKGEGYRQHDFTGERGTRRHTGLLESARILAAMNIAMADAGIACWDGKYTFVSGGRLPPFPWLTATETRRPPQIRRGHRCFRSPKSGVSISPFVFQRSGSSRALEPSRGEYPFQHDFRFVARGETFLWELFGGHGGSQKCPHLCRHTLSFRLR